MVIEKMRGKECFVCDFFYKFKRKEILIYMVQTQKIFVVYLHAIKY